MDVESKHIDDVEMDEIFKKIGGEPYDADKARTQFDEIENAHDEIRNL